MMGKEQSREGREEERGDGGMMVDREKWRQLASPSPLVRPSSGDLPTATASSSSRQNTMVAVKSWDKFQQETIKVGSSSAGSLF